MFLLISQAKAQDIQPQLMTMPQEWEFEYLEFPLAFAPDLDYKGFEELRFAPGMFDTASPSYFTYLFAIMLEGDHAFSEAQIDRFLTRYYQGLSHAVATRAEITVDTSRIGISVMRPDIRTGKHEGYFVTITYMDTFTGGREVKLNMEVVVLYSKNGENTCIQALVSPQPKYTDVWKELYSYRKALMSENPIFVNLRQR